VMHGLPPAIGKAIHVAYARTGGGIVAVTVSHPVTPFVVFWSNRSLNLSATTTEIIQ